MRNRPFELPLKVSPVIPDPGEELKLKNKFSGKTIFRSNLYSLLTGDLSVLDKTENKWFLEELFTHSLRYGDQNLIPALKKISGSDKYEEGERQRASEIIEIIEELAAEFKDQDKISLIRTESEKADAALKLMAGIRYPQTTDILRLLREKSVELKRLALFLIGKFHMTDMIQEVCECLTVQGIESDAVSVLLSFGSSAENDLNRFYLIQSGNISLSKTILRIYSRICPENNMPFLLERLWSNSRQLKEIAVNGLISCGYRAENEDREHLVSIIYDTFGLMARLSSCKICCDENSNQLLYSEIDKEYHRWKDYLLNLLRLAFGNQIPGTTRKNFFEKEDNPERFISELAEIVYGDSGRQASDTKPDDDADRKVHKKLQRFFPGEIPFYNDLLEDIINCDYNLISIWTRAVTLRNIKAIEGENLSQSVVALLFSPEVILREEAALLIARTGNNIYDEVSERIPEESRTRLDSIISGDFYPDDLAYRKVLFLTSLFDGIYEDDLLSIANEMIYISKDNWTIEIEGEGFIAWFLRKENTGPVFNIFYEGYNKENIEKEFSEIFLYGYLLPLKAFDDFSFQHPEHSRNMVKYIDDNEK